MMKRKLLRLIPAVLIGNILFFSPAFAAPDDYNPVTGEPNCIKCHTPDRRYSIDYSRDETCVECHGPGLSDKFLDINDRYKHMAKNEADTANVSKETKADKADAKTDKATTAKKPSKAAPKDMVFVPAGDFTMGSNDWWPKSQPEHTRNVDAFFIDKYEVTNKKYKEFTDATKRSIPDHWVGGKIPAGKENHPVVYVTWDDADAYCKWNGKRLPHEAEWEKAARGTDKRAFPWGDKFDKNKGNTPQYGHEDTLPVGSFESGKSPYGVYDMAGNAWEWVEEWFKPYPGNTHPDENYGEKYKVLRGGSWYDCTYYKCGISAPSYNRIFFHSKTKNNNFGFRCAKDAK